MLVYPSKDGKWTWEQLELLAKALGYQHRIFFDTTPIEKRNESCLKSEGLKHLLESDVLCSSLHKTFNHQNGTYNLKVLHKSIELLTERYLDFNSLQTTRVSFQTYEHTDHAGLEDQAVLRAMHMCGRTMAPLKLRHMLRHMGRLVTDRLMLYEFLEVVASGDDLETAQAQLPPMKIPPPGPDKHQLYQLCAFEDELSTHEQRLYKHLNQKYEDSRREIEVEEPETESQASGLTVLPPSEWAMPTLVNQSVRRDMGAENRKQSAQLRQLMDISSRGVKLKSYNGTCTCVDGEMSKLVRQGENGGSVKEEPTTVAATVTEMAKVGRASKVRHFAPVVTDEEVKESERRIESLKWDIATMSFSQKKRSTALSGKR